MDSSAKPRYATYLVLALLIVLTLAAFWQVTSAEFIGYDDPLYVQNNSHVSSGLSSRNIIWAFTTQRAGNWHPLTWISHMLDARIYGMNPAGHHVTNLLFHIANVLLLFIILRRMTGAVWRSALVAALFAVHPLHVESVAWVSERKDVLSTFFLTLTVLAYAFYVRRPGIKRYLPVVALFALGLMAKPMLVSLPLLLLLLDFWPLRRFGAASDAERSSSARRSISHLLLEKVPLFVMAAASCMITFVAQRAGGAVSELELVPPGVRAANALVAYAEYLVKTIRPLDLALLYPHPLNTLPVWQVAVSGLMLVCLSVVVVLSARNRPYLLAGWLWYMVMLVPVIGIVQVGEQALADRYTYVPLIGIFIILAWGIPDLAAHASEKYRQMLRRTVLPLAAGMVLLFFTGLTMIQVSLWQNSVTLFRHTIAVTDNNFMMNYNLGTVLNEKGDYEEAVKYLVTAAQIRPKDVRPRNNLADTLLKLGLVDQAVGCYKEVLRLTPNSAIAHSNLAIALLRQGNTDEALSHFRESLRIHPNSAQAHYELGAGLAEAKKSDEAIKEFNEAVRLKPDLAEAHNDLAVQLYMAGDYPNAWKELHLAEKCGLTLAPGFVQALSDKMPDPGSMAN